MFIEYCNSYKSGTVNSYKTESKLVIEVKGVNPTVGDICQIALISKSEKPS